MTETKYGSYILKGAAGKSGIEKSAVIEPVLEGPADWKGIQHRLEWKYISAPVQLEEPHSHDFDEFLIFLGGNPGNPKDFGAEIELSLGEEGEKHTITAATVACIPKGLVHFPINFKKVDKPVVFASIYLSPEHSGKPATIGAGSAAGGPKYSQYVLKEPHAAEGPRKLDTEEWGVSINEEITKEIGTFNCNFNFLGILGPHVLVDPPHDHNCDEILFLVPANYDDWPALGGEIEIAIGEEWEKQTIDTAAVICLPPYVVHCPVYMKKVDKPFYWGHILLAPSYGSSAYNPEDAE